MKPSVYYDRHAKQWHARITHDGKRIHVGRYETQTQALQMAEAKIVELSAPKKSPKQLWAERSQESQRRIVAKYRRAV